MDLCITVPRARIEELQSAGGVEEDSASVRSRVMEACERQQYRFRDSSGLRFNSDMRAADLEKYCPLGEKEKGCLRDLFESDAMSVRAYHRIIRVARTIADLEGADRIREEHIYLAYTYRQGEQFKSRA
jgi:magnesium chelatase family protein